MSRAVCVAWRRWRVRRALRHTAGSASEQRLASAYNALVELETQR